MKNKILFQLIIVLFLMACTSSQQDKTTKPSCGDGICQTLESSGKIPCSEDCGTSNESSKSSLIKDISYGTDSSAQKLDLYLPKNFSGKIPLIIEIHGGGFEAGDKYPSQYAEILVSQGYAVTSLNYRLSGESIFPAAVYDVKSAVRWLRANADEYNLDPDNFGSIGGSAGGYFSAFLAVTGDTSEFDIGDNLGYSSKIQAAVDLFGPVNFSGLNEQRITSGFKTNNVEEKYLGCTTLSCETVMIASPVNYINKGDTQILIVHGDKDTKIPIQQSKDFYNLLQNAGVESTFVIAEGLGHGGPGYSERYSNDFIEFFNKHLK